MGPEEERPASQEFDDRPPSSAEESLRLFAEERSRTRRQLTIDPMLLHLPWGITWLIGFGLLFLRYGPNDRVLVDLPEFLPLLVLFALIATATTITTVIGLAGTRQLAGRSSEQGMMYGLAWALGMVGAIAVAARLGPQLDQRYEMLLWSALITFTVGVLYLAGGVIWRDRPLFGFGAWLIVVNVAGLLPGPGWHSLVVALGAGVGFILFAIVSRLSKRGSASD